MVHTFDKKAFTRQGKERGEHVSRKQFEGANK